MNDRTKCAIQTPENETIIAQCTPSGNGAIALVRLSGTDAITIATRIGTLASKKKLTELPSHTIHYGWITNQDGSIIDRVMFLLMRTPKTFTGQNVVEITTHNNPFIINALIERALQEGARPAQEGEFTKRAFLNNKIDLAQAEAINELIHAQTQKALKTSLAQLDGSLSNKITKLEQKLLKALSFSEASFEFVQEESAEFGKQIAAIVANILKEIKNLKKTFNHQEQIRQGIRIALLGSVNAGKSSLFNTLLAQKRAIVTNTPGTTRDVIEAGRYHNGVHQTLIDTAGLRETNNDIEQEGIRRSLREAQKADIILLVYDGSQKLKKIQKKQYELLARDYKTKTILVKNKIDAENIDDVIVEGQKPIAVSCKNETNIDQLEAMLKKKIDSLFSEIESPFLLTQRQQNLLVTTEKKLEGLEPMLGTNVAYELISLHLKDALAQLSEFSGKTISEQALDQVFKQFCVGK